MKKLLLILIVQNFCTGVSCQTFTVDELMTLAYLPSKNIDHYMKKKGFVFSSNWTDSVTTGATFIEKVKSKNKIEGSKRSIAIQLKNDLKHVTLYTPALNEYQQGQQRLIKTGFF